MDKLRTLEHHLHIRHGIHTQLQYFAAYLSLFTRMGWEWMLSFTFLRVYSKYHNHVQYRRHCFEVLERSKPHMKC